MARGEDGEGERAFSILLFALFFFQFLSSKGKRTLRILAGEVVGDLLYSEIS